jgi:hypothetical protein
MRGILRSHYKQVEGHLNKLVEENILNQNYTCPETIFEHKKKLQDIYKNYRETFEKMALLTIQFEEHKHSIKRLIIKQRNIKRAMLKKSKVKTKQPLILS